MLSGLGSWDFQTIVMLERIRKTHALGIDPRVELGFVIKWASRKKIAMANEGTGFAAICVPKRRFESSL